MVTTYQTKIMREQQRASAWPYVSLYHNNAHGGSELAVRNVGLGPALVRSVEVTVDGRPARTWGGMLHAVAGLDSATPLTYSTITSDVGRGSVLLPGSEVENFRLVGPPDLVSKLEQAVRRDRVVRRLCYCSLYDECWTARSDSAEPSPVRACTVDAARAFQH